MPQECPKSQSQEEIVLKLLKDVGKGSPRLGAHGQVFEENLQLLLNERQKNDPKVKLLLKMLT